MKCQLLVLSLTLVAAAFSNVETKTCGRLIQQAFYNGPLISVSKLQSVDDCCAKCSAHEDCKLFVYGGAWKGNTATCSLLSDMTEHWDTPLGGPIFHTVLMDITPEECKTPVGSQCGNTNRTTCCPTGSYCQPWNSNFYQCLETPEKCEKMETDIDFYGNDIKHISSLTPAECCEECSKTPGCQAFTFVNDMPDGPWCYLKSSADGRTSKKGVVSGLRRQFSLRR